MFFSVIAVDYEHHVPRDGMRNGLNSIANQSFKDFELIVCHDGPKTVPYEEEYDFSVFKNPPLFINTEKRMNDWSHSTKDFSMKHASGDYFIHFNIDNLFYPHAFERLFEKLSSIPEEVLIFQIRHWKHCNGCILPGIPPVVGNIDAMQLVASKSVWKDMNYWYFTGEMADGIIYQEMCRKHPWTTLDECLGENF